MIFILINNNHCTIVGEQQFNQERSIIYNDLLYNVFNVSDKIKHKELDNVKILKSLADIYNKLIFDSLEPNEKYKIDK